MSAASPTSTSTPTPTPTPTFTPEFLAQNSSYELMTVCIVFIVICVFFGVARLVSQQIKGRRFGLDDAFSYIGLVFVLGNCIMGFIQIRFAGIGRHAAYLELFDQGKLTKALIVMVPVELVYISSFTFPKLSILCFLLRIFNTRTTRNTTYVLIGLVTATWISEILTVPFQCTPTAFIWDKSIVGGYCVHQDAMFQYWSVPNILTDLAMLVLPIPMVWNLHVNLIQKLALTFTFFLGSIGLVSSIIRFAMFSRTGALIDPTWASVVLQSWTIVEPSMYYIAGVLPTLRPVSILVITRIRSIIGLSAPYGSSNARARPSPFRSNGSTFNKDGRSSNLKSPSATGARKSWAPLTDKDPTATPAIGLVEYNQAVIGGAVGCDFRDAGDKGITRTHEIVVTHESV